MSIELHPGTLVLASSASSEDWLAARRDGIGASEIAAVAGLSRRRGPWDVWSSKIDGTEFTPTDEMLWGQWIEGRIIDWWAKQTGREVDAGGLYRSAEHPWLLATPDAVVLEPAREHHQDRLARVEDADDIVYADIWETVATVDAKNAGWYASDDWEDGAPIDYICQLTQQMLAVGVRRGYLVAAIGGRPPVEREFALDDDLAGSLIDAGAKLWAHVQDRTPPPVDGSASATAWIRQRYPNGNPALEVELGQADLDQIRRLGEVDESLKALGVVREGIRNALKDRLGDAHAGTHGGKAYVTWKQVGKKGYTVKPSTYRELRITAAAHKGLE